MKLGVHITRVSLQVIEKTPGNCFRSSICATGKVSQTGMQVAARSASLLLRIGCEQLGTWIAEMPENVFAEPGDRSFGRVAAQSGFEMRPKVYLKMLSKQRF